MNYSKVQGLILKDAYKRDRKNEKMNLTWKYAKYGFGYIVTEGHFAVIIPEGFSYLDFDSIFEKEDQLIASGTVELQEMSEVIFDTKTQKVVNGEWCHVFMNKEDEHIYVAEKILKNYVDATDLVFCGRGKKDPVLVFEEGVFIGFIAPVKANEEDE